MSVRWLSSIFLLPLVSCLHSESPKISKIEPVSSPKVSCCWCVRVDTHENKVSPYADACEELGGHFPFGDCKKIQVEGKECSFASFRQENGGLKCVSKNITYFEGNERRTLVPPALDPCALLGTRSLIQAEVLRKSQPEEEVKLPEEAKASDDSKVPAEEPVKKKN